MPFTSTDSAAASDLNNMVRGLARHNASYALTARTAQTDLASAYIPAGTITATGAIHVLAAGTITNVGSGNKTIRLFLAGTEIASIARNAANAQDWFVDAWAFNTANNAQRWLVQYSTTNDTTVSADYITSAIDTASGQTLKLTGTLVNTADTITQTVFDVFVVRVA